MLMTFLFAAAASSGGVPQLMNDTNLSELCSTNATSISRGIRVGTCSGYILGALDTQMMASTELGVTPAFCLPPGETASQVIDSIRRWLRANPPKGYAASSAVLHGLMQTYPCQR